MKKNRILTLIMVSTMFFSACSNEFIENKIQSTNHMNDTKDESVMTKNESDPITLSEDVYEENIEIAIDEAIILENLSKISSNIRNVGSEGQEIASEYLKNKLEEYGYITSIQTFPVHKQTYDSKGKDYFDLNPLDSEVLGYGKNVVAKRTKHDDSKKTIYLTAHYDTTKDTTGVFDNGTGVSVILEVARQLKNFDSPFNIEIVFFGGEEYNLIGSKYFVSNLTELEKNNTIGCINVDMVGQKDAGPIVMRANSGKNNIITLMMNEYAQENLYVLRGGSSDDVSFRAGKLPAITVINESAYHSADRSANPFDYLNSEELKSVAYLITNFLVNFSMNDYEAFLKAEEINSKSDRMYRIGDLSGYKLKNVNLRLIENGYDSETEYIYETELNKEYRITERGKSTVHSDFYKDFQSLDDNENCQYLIHKSSENNTVLHYSVYDCVGAIEGNISEKEAIEILKVYYESYYSRYS